MITKAIAILEDDLAGWNSVRPLTTEEWFQRLLLTRIIRLSHKYAAGPQIHDDYDADGNAR